MKNLKKISRNELKNITGGAVPFPGGPKTCSEACCPPPGIKRCPQVCCLVACPPVHDWETM